MKTLAKTVVLLLLSVVMFSTCASAQEFGQPLGDFFPLDGELPKPLITASLHADSDEPDSVVVLAIEAIMPVGFYTYSLGDDPSSTVIAVTDTTGLIPYDLVPVANHPAKTVQPKGVPRYDKFDDQVVWFQRFRRSGSDEGQAIQTPVTLSGTITLGICDVNGCLPPETFQIEVALGEAPDFAQVKRDFYPFIASATPDGASSETPFIVPISWSVELSPGNALAGEEVTVELIAILDPDYHIFAQTQDRDNFGLPTRITLTALRGLTPRGPGFKEDRSFEKKMFKVGNKEVEQRVFHGSVSWSRSFTVDESATKDGYGAMLGLDYQYCKEEACLRDNQSFQLGYVALTDKVREATVSESASEGTAFDPSKVEVNSAAEDLSLGLALVIAFAAGFILNFMPCVLPVVGLKIMTFVEQAGESRQRAFMLNLSFSLGLLSVFLVLATLARLPEAIGWGAYFSDLTFNIVLVAVVFVFALSFLGIWEIPIPGFTVSSGAGSEGEGLVGAFAKGMLTTVLATPCSGPLLFPALTYAVSQPLLITYLGFTMVGLGMASPYLLIGAYPKLISFLPKPGAWMETFKHIMGFVLLGTVIWLLTIVATVSLSMVVPLVGFLFALWGACWWYGRVPFTSGRRARVKALVQGGLFSAVMGWTMFSRLGLGGVMEFRFTQLLDNEISTRMEELAQPTEQVEDGFELDWKPYSPELLEELTGQQKMVFLDFTADW
jgi:thiol:disulfide interchange protein